MQKYYKNIYVIVGIIGVLVIFGSYIFYSASSRITVTNNPTGNGLTEIPTDGLVLEPDQGLYTATKCAHPDRRPYAVMLGGDSHVRPLAGIGEADIVVEMPVFEDGVNRLMAIFQCSDPAEIGSVRSARHDFIPLAAGFDAIFAHWGGSYIALEQLDAGVVDNINALTNPANAFYRKSSLSAPDNGFTTIDKLDAAAAKLAYRTDAPKFKPYSFIASPDSSEKSAMVLRVKYPGEFRVGYEYNPESNTYTRFRGGLLEIDFNTKEAAAPSNVIVMRATSRMVDAEYNDVDIQGSGDVEIYRNGEVVTGTWEKPESIVESRLTFYDENRQEIQLVPGQIWINIIGPDKEVTWTEQ